MIGLGFALGVIIGTYLTGAGFVFWVHMDSPATLGLAALRAAVWPYYLATGKPEGERLPMD